MKNHKALYITGLILALIWVGAKLVTEALTRKVERDNVFSVSEIRNDDTTYRYVEEKCDRGFFAVESENCANLRVARP